MVPDMVACHRRARGGGLPARTVQAFSDAKRLARQLPDARLIRTRTFAELWVHPARLTTEISEFLDGVLGGRGIAEPRRSLVRQPAAVAR